MLLLVTAGIHNSIELYTDLTEEGLLVYNKN